MWLIALYSFLIISGLVALLLLGALGWSLRRGLRAALLLIVPIWIAANCAFAYAVHRTAYSLEVHDPFCVSCHLHEEEFARFRDTSSPVALDLAGYHWRKAEGFTCISCHIGEGVEGRAHVLYFAGMDVLAYTVGDYERKLTGMKHPLSDAACVKCHAEAKPSGFHASEKHTGYTSNCLQCHVVHARTDEAFGFIDYQRWAPSLLQPCVSCHPALSG